MKWYLLYWGKEDKLRVVEFDSKGKARAYEHALPGDYVVIGRICGYWDAK